MNLNTAPGTIGASVPATALVKDSSDRAFKADVIDASLEAPVLVDFWAPWCGPCRQLTPALEKVINEKAGKIRLVKINIDENPGVAGQLGIQSIPAVFAFAGGRPVDAFMGAIPESEVRKFADKVIAAAPAGTPPEGSMEEELKNALATAAEAFTAGDLNRAAQVFGTVLQHQPDNATALLGMTKVFIEVGDHEKAKSALDLIPEAERKGPDYISAAAAIKLLAEATDLSEADELEQKLETNPDDHQTRFDLAVVRNAEGKRVEAAEALVTLMRRDRAWNDDGARRKLLEFFDAWGPKDPATVKGRRLLSALLFS